MTRVFTIPVLLACSLVTPVANADFSPLSRAEWNSWPDYCKAKHVFLGHGEPYMMRAVPKDMQTKWEQILGFQTWNNIHHGCRGILHIARAERLRGKDEQRYEYELGEAESESNYSLQRTPPGHPIYYKMAAIHARVEYGRGNKTIGLAQLKAILNETPDSPELYATLATYLFREKDYSEARQVLEQGLERVPEPTAEMHYFLGLVLVKLEAWEEAREHAIEAYRLGYPLPGLRNKLKAAGHWSE